MNAVMKICGFSANGSLYLNVSDFGICAALKSLVELCTNRHGGFVMCEFSPPYPRRTLKENAKWWSMCTEFANYCGMTKSDVADGVKFRAMEEGLWRSESIPFSRNGGMRPVSTAKSNTKEMSVLIDVLYRIAAEHGYTFKEMR